MLGYTISEVRVPATIDDEDASDFIDAINVGNEVEKTSYGTDELAFSPTESLIYWRDPHKPLRTLAASVDGRIVGIADYETRVGEDADSAWLTTKVLPEFRGRGIGGALADAIEELVRADGKRKALVYTPSPDAPGERLTAPTGSGSVPRDNPEVQFLLGRGYRLEQVERSSRLALRVAGLDQLLANAGAASGPDYRVIYNVGATPDEWLEDVAVLATRMSTDAPSGGLEEEEDPWTVDRLVEAEKRELDSPRVRISTMIEHLPSGHLVGFSELSVPPEATRPVHQEATLVLKEHRGHQLGMLLKIANLEHLARVRPGHPSIYTWNAEENRHMLSVNEAIGFAPFAYEGAWRKDLA